MAKDLNSMLRGRNSEQQAVIKYFMGGGGCMSKVMDDAQYDEMVAKKVSALNIKELALNHLGLDEDQVKEVEPVHFENWKFDTPNSLAKLGKDNVWRSTSYQVTWIFFSEEQVYIYQYTLNMNEDGKKEQTEEYFYKDITNFSSSSEAVEKEDVLVKTNCKGQGIYDRRIIETNIFKIVVPGDKLECSLKKNSYTDSAIQGMKAKLREKKNA